MSSSSQDKTIYVYDPEAGTLIPYRPDYNRGVPFVVTQNVTAAVQQQQQRGRGLSTTAPKQDKQLGVIVPLIRQPPNQSDWVQLATIAQKYPRVNTIAIVSPTRDERGIGDFGGPDPEYVNAIRFLQNAGITVVGYLDTDSVNRPLDESKRDVDRWKDWYPDVTGLFFDNVPTSLTVLEYYRQLDEYAKKEKGFDITIADMASAKQGGAVVLENEGFFRNTTINIFVIYEREGYPADSWYVNMRRGWMSAYPRSRFAFIPYRVSEDTLACRNFIDKVVGIEKMAGYIYVHSAYETDHRKLKQWTNISPMLEITLQQLDTMARQEGIPFSKGVTPERTKPLTEKEIAVADARAITGTSSEEEVSEIHRADIATDKFGIRKIYPTNPIAAATKEWYIFMDNPRADSKFKNLPDTFQREADGSWSTPRDNDNVRLEVWSPSPKNKYHNVEMTGYFKTLQLPTKKSDRYVVQQYARGGRHDDEKKKNIVCEGSAYKTRLLRDGAVDCVKEIYHGALTGSRATTQATNRNLVDRWIGMKSIIYNYPKVHPRTGEEQTFVAVEVWIDDNVTDENGNLVIKNDWKPMMKMYDEGGWFVKGEGKNKKGKKLLCNREPDEILTEPGGSDEEGNCVAWRWSGGTVINFKYLSVREIDVVRRD